MIQLICIDIRVVIEQALKDLPSKESGFVWDRLVELQRAIGDLSSIVEAENRRAEALGRSGMCISYQLS